MDINKAVLEWLLEPDNPSVQYRTLREILGRPKSDRLVRQAHAGILTSKITSKIFSKMHPKGYWLHRGVGAGVEYAGAKTTHYNLAFLAELGLHRDDDPRLKLAAERYLNLQQPDGDFWQHLSCLTGMNLKTFALLGYQSDPRVKKSLQLLLSTKRKDGGFLCDIHEGKYKQREVKSCVRGSVKALVALSLYRGRWRSKRCQELVDYFLRRRVLYSSKKPTEFVTRDVASLSFPPSYGAGLQELLLALSTMGYGKHPALKDAWDCLEQKRDAEGKFPLDWNPPDSYFVPGKRGLPNKWTTFYCYLARARARA